MAELNEGGGGDHGAKKGAVRAKKMSTKIDMTPMVDLAFLLVTFFMLTTTFSKPSALAVIMPDKDDKTPKDSLSKVPASEAITLLIAQKNRIFYYKGVSENPEVLQSDYSAKGIRKVLMSFDSTVKVIQQSKGKKQTGPVVLIKPTDAAQYGHVVDILDEMKITGIQRYAIVDVTPEELKMLPAN